MKGTTYRLTEAEREIYRRYAGLSLPRHTSYPIAPVWSPDFGPNDLRDGLRRLRDSGRPLSLYVHVPFCESLCYYCACTKEIVPAATRHAEDPADAYLGSLAVEAMRFADVVGAGPVRQVHLGGGTPTFLSPSQLTRLWHSLSGPFEIADDAEISVEVDPRVTTREHLGVLRDLGFNRVSLGIQDFEPEVQDAVHRTQSFEVVERCVADCRALDFSSINFDMIYGLPYQTLASMSNTLDQAIALAPDRIAFYRLAVIPEIFRWQNAFDRTDMPAGDLPLDLNLLAIDRFRGAGYVFVGLDHFAKPTDPLATALRDGSIRRNFQGMTTGAGLDILGLGPSAISELEDGFAQNAKTTADWHQAVGADFATERGLSLTADDRVRRELMRQLYGFGRIDKRSLERQFAIVFDAYFADEIERLRRFVDEGIVTDDPDAVALTEPLGRLLVRVVAALFDRYLPPDASVRGIPQREASKVG